MPTIFRRFGKGTTADAWAEAYAKNCVDCTDDRSLCAEMFESDKTTDENVEEVRKLIKKDSSTLAGATK
jgi:hypothetical protein